jgi:hypothetical protein
MKLVTIYTRASTSEAAGVASRRVCELRQDSPTRPHPILAVAPLSEPISAGPKYCDSPCFLFTAALACPCARRLTAAGVIASKSLTQLADSPARSGAPRASTSAAARA